MVIGREKFGGENIPTWLVSYVKLSTKLATYESVERNIYISTNILNILH